MIRRVIGVLGRQSIAILALVVAVSGGTAYAASAMWTGSNIVDGSLTGADIQNGSITAADLAAGGGSGGGASPLLAVEVGPLDFDPDAAQDPLSYILVAPQTVQVVTSGFHNIYLSAQMSADAGLVCPDQYGDVPVSFSVSIAVDGSPLSNGVGYPNVPGQSMYLPMWLTAGTHTISSALFVNPCAPGYSAGQIHLDALRYRVTAA